MNTTNQHIHTSLGTLAPGSQIQVGPFGSQLHAGDYTNSGIAVVMPSDLKDGRIDLRKAARISPDVASLLKAHTLKHGDLIFGRRGDIGRVAVVDEADLPAICGTGCIRVRLPPELHSAIVLEACRAAAAQRWLISHAVGQTMLNISAPILARMPLTLPPRNRHDDIVRFIAAADQALDLYKRLITAQSLRRNAILKGVFSQALMGVGKSSGAEPPLQQPTPWASHRLGDFGEVYSGGTPPTGNPVYWNGGIQWSTPTDISRLRSRFIDGTEKSLSAAGLARCSAKLLPVGSVLVCTRATVGACAIARTPIATNQGFKSIAPHLPTDSEFLYYLIEYLRPQLIRRSTGSTFLELTGPRFASTQCVAPNDPAERHAIGRLLGQLDDAISLLGSQYDLLSQLKRSCLAFVFATSLPKASSSRSRVS